VQVSIFDFIERYAIRIPKIGQAVLSVHSEPRLEKQPFFRLPCEPKQQITKEAAELYFHFTKTYGTINEPSIYGYDNPFTGYKYETPEFQTKLLNSLLLAQSLDDRIYLRHSTSYIEPALLSAEDKQLFDALSAQIPEL
jgi:hypothetical protein